MRTIFNATALAFCFLLQPVSGQEKFKEKPKDGFVRLANAVAFGSGPLQMEINGKRVDPKGYQIGDVTGAFSLKPGNHQIKFLREGVKEGTTRVNVATDETTTMIPYAERIPATDDEPAHWALRILRLKQQDPQQERSATFVSVSLKPEVEVEIRDPQGNWTSVFVKRLAIGTAPILYPRGYVPMRTQGRDLEPIGLSTEGNYVVLLYDNGEGKLQSLNFFDQKFLSAD